MSQHIRSGGTFVGTWWSSEANQAFQPLEAEFDAPSQAIKSKHISRSEVRRCERGHEDNPVCGGERSFRDLIAFPLSVPARLASRGRSSLRRLLDGNQTQSKSSAALASDPDRPIDAPACRCVAQLGNKIKRITLGIEPARALPASTDEEVSPGVEDDCHAIGLQIGTIANADLALDHRYPVERLARLLIGQLEIVKAFARKIERAMNAPQLALLLGRRSCFRDRGRINDTDRATPDRLGRGSSQRLAHQHGHTIPALTQAVEPRHIGNVDEPDRGCPCRGRSQASLAETIRQDQAQQIHRIIDLEHRRPAKPGDDTLPILVHKRFVSHPKVESQAIPRRKHYFSAYAPSRGQTTLVDSTHSDATPHGAPARTPSMPLFCVASASARSRSPRSSPT